VLQLLTSTDIAFSSSSIVTRDVAGSAFQYAKIMTLPFFGSGIVELPPDGFKRAKNSQKMQMVFFVHEGKVLVTVGPKAIAQKGGAAINSEMNEFAISKGGVWVVPRGMSLNSSCPFTSRRRNPPARAQKATLRHHRGSMAPTELWKEERSAKSATSSFSLRRCRAGAVCATSRRNNLSIAHEHSTSCAPLQRRPVPSFSRDSVALGEPSAPRRSYIAAASTRVFGCTTGRRSLLGRQNVVLPVVPMWRRLSTSCTSPGFCKERRC
jgi:hypothetical protein